LTKFDTKNLYFDENRARIVFDRLYDSYQNRLGIFNLPKEKECPSYNLPSNLTNKTEQALFYFYSILGDARVKSQVNYAKFKKLHEKDKKYFDSKSLADRPYPPTEYEIVEKGTLEYVLGLEIGSPTPVRLARYIISSSKILTDKYDSNPLNIFLEIKDVKEAHKKILKEFDGYGRNLSSLLLTFYIKHDLIHFDNENALPPKIDFHDVTILLAFGILKPKFNDAELGFRRDIIGLKLQEFLSYFAQKYNYNIIHLDSALWVLGSNVCSKFDWLECWDKCPVKEYCHIKPGSDLKKSKKNGKIISKDYMIYPFKESRIKNIGDLNDLFIPNFPERILL